jgi:hypothetical protein
MLWDVMGCFGMFWDVMGCFGMLLKTIKIVDIFIGCFRIS